MIRLEHCRSSSTFWRVSLLVLVSILVWLSWSIEWHQVWGMQMVEFFQPFRTYERDLFMKFISFTAFEAFFALVPFFLWSADPKLFQIGVRLTIGLTVLGLCCAFLKIGFQEPRPFWINPALSVSKATGSEEFSYPSGHSWAASFFWSILSVYLPQAFLKKIKKPEKSKGKKRATVAADGLSWSWRVFSILGLFAPIFPMLSRVYFAVHYPHDVLAGCVCGWISFLIFIVIDVEFGLFWKRVTFVSLEVSFLVLLALFGRDFYDIQQSLLYGVSAMLSLALVHLLNPESAPPPIHDRRLSRQLARVLLGTPPIFGMFMLYYSFPQAPFRIFVGLISPYYLFVIAPKIFHFLHLS